MESISPGAVIRSCQDWWRSLRAGFDPDGVTRECASRTTPFILIFPGMGRVHFVATSDGAREILTLPHDVLCAPTPNPIEPIVGPSSVILTSGEQHRRQRKMLSPVFRGAHIRGRAYAMAFRRSSKTRPGGVPETASRFTRYRRRSQSGSSSRRSSASSLGHAVRRSTALSPRCSTPTPRH
jgi:hypothetical protein